MYWVYRCMSVADLSIILIRHNNWENSSVDYPISNRIGSEKEVWGTYFKIYLEKNLYYLSLYA